MQLVLSSLLHQPPWLPHVHSHLPQWWWHWKFVPTSMVMALEKGLTFRCSLLSHTEHDNLQCKLAFQALRFISLQKWLRIIMCRLLLSPYLCGRVSKIVFKIPHQAIVPQCIKILLWCSGHHHIALEWSKTVAMEWSEAIYMYMYNRQKATLSSRPKESFYLEALIGQKHPLVAVKSIYMYSFISIAKMSHEDDKWCTHLEDSWPHDTIDHTVMQLVLSSLLHQPPWLLHVHSHLPQWWWHWKRDSHFSVLCCHKTKHDNLQCKLAFQTLRFVSLQKWLCIIMRRLLLSPYLCGRVSKIVFKLPHTDNQAIVPQCIKILLWWKCWHLRRSPPHCIGMK